VISKPPKSIDEIFAEGTPIDDALRRAAQEAVRRHKLLGIPVVAWKDGRVVHVAPEDIVLQNEDDHSKQ
jgi:hypothetical protein